MKPELIYHLSSQTYFCVILISLRCVGGQLLDQLTELHLCPGFSQGRVHFFSLQCCVLDSE